MNGLFRGYEQQVRMLDGINRRVRQMVPIVFAIILSSGLVMPHDISASDKARPVKPEAPSMSAAAAIVQAHSRSEASNGQATKPPFLPAEIMGQDGAPMVLVPAGVFAMGSDNGDDDEFPIHRVQIDAFYIDTFEVTNERFAKYVDAIQSEPPWGFEAHLTPITHADRPVRWVSWLEAVGYCFWAGKRLPTEAEWEKAARGTDGRIYPWGNNPPNPVHAVYGLKAVSDIGDREAGKSPYGVYDMAGNLYEWVLDWYAPDYYANFAYEVAVNPRGPSSGRAKVQRGGSYTNTSYRLRSTFRTKGDPLEQDPRVGFRCAMDATPAH